MTGYEHELLNKNYKMIIYTYLKSVPQHHVFLGRFCPSSLKLNGL